MMSDDGKWIHCSSCGTKYFLPIALYTAAKANEHISFNCPYGHSAHYPKGETDADKLRRERDMLRQRVAEKDDAIARAKEREQSALRSAAAQKGQVTRLKNRSKAGVCPCCNRTFKQLAAHMKSQHPHFAEDEPLKVIQGGAA